MFPLHLNALARRQGAAHFWRNVPSAQVLLRMLLLWSLCGFGLRSVAAWAQRSGWASISADSLRYRFRHCEDFLIGVLTHVLAHWMRVDASEGLPLRLVDASMLAVAGPSGRCFRVHAVFDPRRGVLTSVSLTDDKAGESVTRGPHVAGDLVIADRGLAHALPLIALSARHAWWLVRVHLGNLKLWNAAGTRVDLRAESLCDAADAAGKACEHDVELRDGTKAVKARLVLVPLPKARAEAARAALRKRSQKKGKTTDARSLRLAGDVLLVRTVRASVASAEAILQWYRVRWQIELFFKRCKSLLGLQTVTSASDSLQRVRVLSSLLVAALVDRLNEPALALDVPTPASAWRWTHVHHLDLVRAVSGDTALSVRHARVATTEQRLRDRPRKRHRTHASRTIAAITNPRDSLWKAAA
jgi:hypothetical protein